MSQNQNIGFIGLGTMGAPMAKQILKKGFSLFVYDIRHEAMEPLLEAGAKKAKSIRDIAETCNIIITMLPDTPDVKKVLLGGDSVIEYAKKETTVIDMSTISPSVTEEIAEKLEKRGINMLDAPVSGGPKMAEEGNLSIMVGGQKEVFEKCLPILECMGKTIVYMGSHGSGQIVKLCNQIICVLNIQAICEALSLARSKNIDLPKVIEALKGGAAGSWMMKNMAPRIIKGDASAGFKIRLQVKDIRLALELAEKEKVPLPATSLVKNLYLEAMAHGEENNGNQALFRVYERLTGRSLKYGGD